VFLYLPLQATALTGSKGGSSQAGGEHVSAPMSSLRDPASFAPPPRRVDSGGVTAGTSFQEESRTGPLTPAEYRAKEEAKLKLEKEHQRLEKEERLRLKAEQRGEQVASGPGLPYRANTTGLSTDQFVPPIARRTAPDGTIVTRPTGSSTPKPKPSLPPRLPDRQNSTLQIGAPPQPPRLPARSSTGSSSGSVSDNKTQLNELQSVFAARSRATFPASSSAPAQDVAWTKQKQRNDAASYTSSPTREDEDSGGPINMSDNTAQPKKKAPPPVPKKRAEGFTGASTIGNNGPPPIPLSTKPKPK